MLVTSLIAVAVATWLLVSDEPIIVLSVAFFVLYLALLDGVLVIAPREMSRRSRKTKVFCIGLSRTGTTSITVALHQLGFEAHHQCHALVDHDDIGQPRVCRKWADSMDAHADIAPATVFEELASLYPDARFVLTQRNPRAWGHAMIRFCKKNRCLFAVPVPPVNRMFSDIYGRRWPSYTVEDWAQVYEAHERKVDAAFAAQPHRLLRLNITGGDGWAELCEFIGENVPSTPFPHADVFRLSAVEQVGWQLSRLRKRYGRLALALVLLLLAVRPAIADHRQCERACRVANGRMNQRAPSVLGARGSWFEEGISGRRLYLSSPSECRCFATSGGATVGGTTTGGSDIPMIPHPIVPRVHPFIETAKQWHFLTSRVCGSDGSEYSSAAAARRKGAQVVNCGQCSKCAASRRRFTLLASARGPASVNSDHSLAVSAPCGQHAARATISLSSPLTSISHDLPPDRIC